MIHYRVCQDVGHLVLLLRNKEGKVEDKVRVDFNHKKHIYPVNILETDEHGSAHLEIYMPGEIIRGWQQLDWIQLHVPTGAMNGQFNHTADEMYKLVTK